MWKINVERTHISYARYFFSDFASHANSYYRNFQYTFPTPEGTGPPQPLFGSVLIHTVANYLLVVKSETNSYFRSV